MILNVIEIEIWLKGDFVNNTDQFHNPVGQTLDLHISYPNIFSWQSTPIRDNYVERIDAAVNGQKQFTSHFIPGCRGWFFWNDHFDFSAIQVLSIKSVNSLQHVPFTRKMKHPDKNIWFQTLQFYRNNNKVFFLVTHLPVSFLDPVSISISGIKARLTHVVFQQLKNNKFMIVTNDHYSKSKWQSHVDIKCLTSID